MRLSDNFIPIKTHIFWKKRPEALLNLTKRDKKLEIRVALLVIPSNLEKEKNLASEKPNLHFYRVIMLRFEYVHYIIQEYMHNFAYLTLDQNITLFEVDLNFDLF